MDNLIELIGKQFTPDVVDTLGSLSGITPAQTQNALGAVIPSLVGTLAKQGGTPAGAQVILDLVGKQTGGADVLGNLAGLLGGSDSSRNLLSSGAGIVSSLLGGNTSKIIDVIASIAGIRGGSASSLLNSIAPVVLAMVGKQVVGNKLNASGLANLLAGQTDFVKAAAPKAVFDTLGFSAGDFSAPEPAAPRVMPAAPRVTPPAVPSPRLNPQPEPPSPMRPMKWLWWLLGAAALLALLWFLVLRPKPVTIQALPVDLQAPVCTAINTLDQTVKGLPTIDANTTVTDLQAGQNKVKVAFDGVVNVLATVRPAEAKTLQTAYKTYSDLISGITGSTVGASAQKVMSARQAVVDAEGKLLQGYNCK